MAAITDPQQLNERRERSYPRVVKRARHNHYPVKKPATMPAPPLNSPIPS